MSLLSYNEVRPWARAIKQKVTNREMPPWYAHPGFGTFRNPRRLTQEEINTLVAWADGGAPQGDGPAPATPDFAEGWSHPSGRPPDYILEMPFEFEVAAEEEELEEGELAEGEEAEEGEEGAEAPAGEGDSE